MESSPQPIPSPNPSTTDPSPSTPPQIPAGPGCAVTVSIKTDTTTTTLCLILGASQAQPWLETAITNLLPNDTISTSRGEVTLLDVTSPIDNLGLTPTRDALLIEAENLRLQGNDVFKAATDFKSYKQATRIYHRALSHLRSAGDDPLLQVKLRGNLALCALRMAEWTAAIVQCDAVLALDPRNGKAFFRRALALVELDMFVRALSDLREAARICPDDVAVSKELARVERESLSTIEKRRKGFAEVYNVMPSSSVYKDVIPA